MFGGFSELMVRLRLRNVAIVLIAVLQSVIVLLFQHLADSDQVSDVLGSDLELGQQVIDELRMAILMEIIHCIELTALLRCQLFTDAVDVTDGLDDLTGLLLVIVVLVDFSFEFLLQLGIHTSNVRYIRLKTRNLLLFFKELFLHFGKRFPFLGSNALHLIVNHLFALF